MTTLTVVPSLLKAPKIDKPDAEYKRLAKKLGVSIAVNPSNLMLQHILTELSIAAYDLTAVRRYLMKQRPEGHVFCWVPVVKSQTISPPLQSRFPRNRRSDGVMNHGFITRSGYNKPIPYPVLVTMETVLTKSRESGFEPQFYISDYTKRDDEPRATRRVDPFLAVGTEDSDALFVIERWDEPAFREEVYSKKTVTPQKAR